MTHLGVADLMFCMKFEADFTCYISVIGHPSTNSVCLSYLGYILYDETIGKKTTWGRKGLLYLPNRDHNSASKSQGRNSNSVETWIQKLIQMPWRVIAY